MARTRRGPPAPDPAAELVQLAIDLDLTGLADALPNLLLKAEKEALSFTDFALALLRAEASVRAERRLQRSLKYSKLTDVEGLDGFEFASRSPTSPWFRPWPPPTPSLRRTGPGRQTPLGDHRR
jgi:hypothetical protein